MSLNEFTERMLRYPIPISLLKGDSITVIKTFFEKYNLPELLEVEVLYLKDISFVRNSICHNGGFVPESSKSEKRIQTVASRRRGVRIEKDSEGSRISIDPEFCCSAQDFVSQMFTRLFDLNGMKKFSIFEPEDN